MLAVPGHAAIEKITIPKFTASNLNQSQIRLLNLVAKRGELTQATCSLYVSNSASVSQQRSALQQAQKVCNYLKTKEGSLNKVSVKTVKTSVRAIQGKTAVSFQFTSEIAKPVPTILTGEPLDSCRLKETQNQTGAGPKGFPHSYRNVPPTGEIKIVFVPVDFATAPGTISVEKRFGDVAKQLEDWSKYFSRGKMSYKVVTSDTWFRVPKNPEWFDSRKPLQTLEQQMDQIVQAAESKIDFSGATYINVVFSPGSTPAYLYGDFSLTYKGITNKSFVFGGYNEDWMLTGPLWDYTIHEILHPQGFIGHGPDNGGPWGIGMNQWGRSEAVTSWEGFLAGWYGEEEILCLDPARLPGQEIQLSSIDEFGFGYESVMIRLSEEEMLVVEYRKPGTYNANPESLTVYQLNVNKSHYRCDSCNQLEAEQKNWWSYLREYGSIRITNSVTFKGVTVKNLGDGKIQISKN